jgi:hypothetical protein
MVNYPENYHGILSLTLKANYFMANVIKKFGRNLLPFHGNYQGNIDLYHRMMVSPWNGIKLPW